MASPAPAAPTAETPAPGAELYRDPEQIDFGKAPDLPGKLAASPHRYFRFINAEFARAVCARFGPKLGEMPTVALHGDAHLEQYAVTDLGRGLTDFDDSSRGPAAIDLVRFETSVRLAARQLGWQDDEERLVATFKNGYRAALSDPTLEAPVPAVVTRFKSRFTKDRRPFLEYAEGLMDPFESDPRVDAKRFFSTVAHYVDVMQAQRGDLPAGFFEVKRAGVLRVGIGSALDKKFLLRLDGPTRGHEDDIIVEVKEVKTLSEVSCIKKNLPNKSLELRDPSPDTYRAEYDLGFVFLPGADYWVHEWSANYEEVKVSKTFESPEELAEVVFDVGVQLGRGHAMGERKADPSGASGAKEIALSHGKLQLAMLARHENAFSEAARHLAAETTAAWERFRREADQAGLLAKSR